MLLTVLTPALPLSYLNNSYTPSINTGVQIIVNSLKVFSSLLQPHIPTTTCSIFSTDRTLTIAVTSVIEVSCYNSD